MKILLFLKSLVTHWINAVSGTILAVVLTFGPNFISAQYIGWVQFIVVVVAILVACYLAWREQYDGKIALTKRLKIIEDSTPKFAVKIVDERTNTFEDLKQTIKEKLESAQKELRKAPAPHPFLAAASILGEPTTSDWQEYIERLHVFEERLKVINDNAQAIINLDIKNIGHVSDEAINVVMHFKDAEVIPDFYLKHIELEMPDTPGFHYAFGGASYQNRQGIKRETLRTTSSLLKIEISRMHPDEKVYASYNPIFLKITGANPKVDYEIRTKCLPSVVKGALRINQLGS